MRNIVLRLGESITIGDTVIATELPAAAAPKAQMTLREYLKRNRISQRALAADLRPPVTQSLVWQWLEGKSQISIGHAAQIIEMSDGQVSLRHLAGLHREVCGGEGGDA